MDSLPVPNFATNPHHAKIKKNPGTWFANPVLRWRTKRFVLPKICVLLFMAVVPLWVSACYEGLTQIEITPDGGTIEVGKGMQFSVTGYYKDGSTKNLYSEANWWSDNRSVATVANSLPFFPSDSETYDGWVFGISGGQATITASLDGKSDRVIVYVVLPPPNTPVAGDNLFISHTRMIPVNPTITVNETLQMGVEGVFSDGTSFPMVPSSWWEDTLNVGIISVSPEGLVTGISEGSSILYAQVEYWDEINQMSVVDYPSTVITVTAGGGGGAAPLSPP